MYVTASAMNQPKAASQRPSTLLLAVTSVTFVNVGLINTKAYPLTYESVNFSVYK